MKDLVNDGFRNVVKPYIDGEDKKSREIIAPVEVSPAEAAHSIGDQIVYNGILYDVTAAIAIGDALATSGAGENISAADDITTQLKNHTVTTDATPTKNSTNPVQSGGVYTSEQNIFAVMGTNGAKNLLPNNAATNTSNGITFTRNSDGSITANGTATANAYCYFYDCDGNEPFVGEEVILSGCPSGGASDTYKMVAYRAESQDGSTGSPEDIGEEIKFTWLNDGSGTKARVYIAIYSGQTVSNLVFKPMIRLASDTDPTYQPYAKTNHQLTQDSVSWEDYSELGAVNWCHNDITTPQTVSDGTTTFTFTPNADKSITVSAPSYPVTLASQINLVLHTFTGNEDFVGKVVKVSGGVGEGIRLVAYRAKSVNGSTGSADVEASPNIFTWLNNGSGTKANIKIEIIKNAVLTKAVTFKPMITNPSYNGPYVPYAMTNRELTEVKTTSVTAKGVTLNIVKSGNVCVSRLSGSLSENVAPDTTILTIPDGYKPISQVVFLTSNKLASLSNYVAIAYHDNGAVQPSGVGVATGDALRGSACWITLS